MRHPINSFSRILAIVLLTLIALPAWAWTQTCIDGIYYRINDNEAHVTWKGYGEYVYKGHVTIPSHITYQGKSYPVTAISNCAFTDCTKLTSVTIPNTVTSIGNSGFYACKGLTSVTIPNSVTTIGNLAFANCDHLTSVTISNSAVSIGERAFGHCHSLTSVVIPNSVKTIGEFAFGDCGNLTSVYIPNSVESIGKDAFGNSSKLTSVTVPKSATIGAFAFSSSTKVIRSDAGPAPTPTPTPAPATNSNTDVKINYTQNVYAYKASSGKYGCKNMAGDIVVQPTFEFISTFNEGYAVAQSGGKRGYINESGRWVVQPRYDKAFDVHEGIGVIVSGSKQGYVDMAGNVIVQPKYDRAFNFMEGFGMFELNGKRGYVNKSGTVIAQPKFDKAFGFSGGVAVVEINGKRGYINESGNYIVEPKFDSAYDFKDGAGVVVLNGKRGYVGLSGRYIAEPKFDKAFDFCGDFAVVELNGKRGYIDKSGNYITPIKYDKAFDFSEGFGVVELNGKRGYVDSKGNYLIEPTLSDALSFSEGLAGAVSNGKSGFIDKTGKFVIEPKFNSVCNFSEGYAAVKVGDKYGCINKSGDFLVSPKYDEAFHFENGVATVKLDGKEGYLDRFGSYHSSKSEAVAAVSKAKSFAQSSYADYINNKVGSWDAFLAAKGVQKPKIADASDIKMQVEREINVWQQKDEFETTAQWQQRVNDTSRDAKVKEITARIQKENNDKVARYNRQLANSKEEYENKVRQAAVYYCSVKAEGFASQQFELKPYDADNQTFLISSQTAGDILLPVPISQAQAFKKNWSSIKNSVKAEYVPTGNDVALKSVTFGSYTYDSNTKANYAVTTIDYNFKPIEISEADLAAVDYNFDAIDSNKPSMTVSNPEAKTVSTTKVTPQQNRLTAGNASDVDRNIPTGAAKAANTFAIVIANENYKNVEKVDNAANDGKIVAKYLTSALGIPQSQVFSYTNASYGEMLDAFDRINNIAKAYSGSDYNVIFYYAGHGVPDEQSHEAYLLPIDGKPGSAAVNIALSKVYDTLGSLGASSVYVMLDACFSGAQRGDGMLAQARGVAIKAKTTEPRGNMVVLSAAQGDETAYPYKSQSHGLFTYFLLKKLQLTRGNVTLGDLADYIIDNVKKTSVIENNGKLQTPTVRASQTAPTDWRAQKLTK